MLKWQCSLAAAMAIAMLRVLCYIFVYKFLFNAHFDLEPDYIIRKPIVHRIQRCILRREILSTFHTRVDYRSVRHFPIEKNRAQIPKNARNHARNCPSCKFTPNLPLPLRRSPPKSNTSIPSPTPLTTPNGIRIQSAVLPLFQCVDRQMRMFSNISALLAILIQSDALTT